MVRIFAQNNYLVNRIFDDENKNGSVNRANNNQVCMRGNFTRISINNNMRYDEMYTIFVLCIAVSSHFKRSAARHL